METHARLVCQTRRGLKVAQVAGTVRRSAKSADDESWTQRSVNV